MRLCGSSPVGCHGKERLSVSAPYFTQQALHALHDTDRRQRISALIETPQPIAIVAGGPCLHSASHLGTLAGSFNPPTLAHEALAMAARATAGIDCVLWTISRVTVDKERIVKAPLIDRLLVLETMTERHPHMAVALIDAGLYVDQARILRDAFPHLSDLTLIMGFDKIVQIFDARYYRATLPDDGRAPTESAETQRDRTLRELCSLARIIVAPRADDGPADLRSLLDTPRNRPFAAAISMLPLEPALRGISSTDLRARIAAGGSITDTVPPEALALVEAGCYA